LASGKIANVVFLIRKDSFGVADKLKNYSDDFSGWRLMGCCFYLGTSDMHTGFVFDSGQIYFLCPHFETILEFIL
jgi:hypothetical protein